MFVKTDLEGFVRDTASNAVINTNVERMNLYKQQREERIKMQEVVRDVEALKHDIGEIKDMLIALTKRQ